MLARKGILTAPDNVISGFRMETTKVAIGSKTDIQPVKIGASRKLAMSHFPQKDFDTRSNL